MSEDHSNAHRQFETNPENLAGQRKKNTPGTKSILMVNNHYGFIPDAHNKAISKNAN